MDPKYYIPNLLKPACVGESAALGKSYNFEWGLGFRVRSQ